MAATPALQWRLHPQFVKSPDGKLWFLPSDGASVLDPRHLPFNRLPHPVHVEKITLDRETHRSGKDQNRAVDRQSLSLLVVASNQRQHLLPPVDRSSA